jgi:hypothetical protein
VVASDRVAVIPGTILGTLFGVADAVLREVTALRRELQAQERHDQPAKIR